jgi:hypothetical protein
LSFTIPYNPSTLTQLFDDAVGALIGGNTSNVVGSTDFVGAADGTNNIAGGDDGGVDTLSGFNISKGQGMKEGMKERKEEHS